MALPIIEVPKYSVTVPSTGDKVQYRPYLVKEEKILMIAMESESQEQMMTAVKSIIDVCTFKTLDIDRLTTFDLEYIFLKLRAKSVGEVATVGLKCSSCSEVNEVEINLDTINVRWPEEASKDGIVMLTDKVGIKFNYPSVKDATKMQDLEGIESIMTLIISCIDNIFDADNVYPASDSTPKEMMAFLDSLNSEQFKKIQGFFESMPNLSHETKFACEHCEHENTLVLRGLASFFG